MFEERCAKLLQQVDVDAFLVVHLEGTDPDGASMFYLTGYPGFGVLLVTPQGVHAYASATNIGMARQAAPHLDWQLLGWEYQKEIGALIRKHAPKRVAFAARRMGYYTASSLQAEDVAEFVIEDDPINYVRSIKQPSEIAAIRRATEITEEALAQVLQDLRLGQTEAEIAWRLECEMRTRGAEGLAFDLIVSAGENSALPHHRPDSRSIQASDLLLFDIGAKFDGYCSDMTRVVSIGPASPRWKELYEVVLNANQAGIETFAPGVSGPQVDQAARNVIADAGYAEFYPHGLSHGVGIEVHELPMSEGRNAVAAYQPGMVCTAEPGIYLPGEGGIRIEDLLAITDTGYELLTSFPKDRLIELDVGA